MSDFIPWLEPHVRRMLTTDAQISWVVQRAAWEYEQEPPQDRLYLDDEAALRSYEDADLWFGDAA